MPIRAAGRIRPPADADASRFRRKSPPRADPTPTATGPRPRCKAAEAGARRGARQCRRAAGAAEARRSSRSTSCSTALGQGRARSRLHGDPRAVRRRRRQPGGRGRRLRRSPASGSPPWCRSTSVYIDANFKETQLARIAPGQPVTIAVDAYPDREIDGVVESVSPASGSVFSLLPPDNATGNFTKIVQRLPVRIRVPAGRRRRGPAAAGPVGRWSASIPAPAPTDADARPRRARAAAVQHRRGSPERTP